MSPFLTSVAPAPFVGSSWTGPLTWSGHHCSASQLSSCQSSDSLPFSPGPKYALYTKSIKHIHVRRRYVCSFLTPLQTDCHGATFGKTLFITFEQCHRYPCYTYLPCLSYSAFQSLVGFLMNSFPLLLLLIWLRP